jgi:hypothetical protein
MLFLAVLLSDIGVKIFTVIEVLMSEFGQSGRKEKQITKP